MAVVVVVMGGIVAGLVAAELAAWRNRSGVDVDCQQYTYTQSGPSVSDEQPRRQQGVSELLWRVLTVAVSLLMQWRAAVEAPRSLRPSERRHQASGE